MAVNIITVYQKVLAIANKEKRGYLTPQEFNLFADQAQKEIFEQYFYDLNQFKRVSGNTSEYSDMVDYLEDKISFFQDVDSPVTVGVNGNIQFSAFIYDIYRLTQVSVKYLENSLPVIAEQNTQKDMSIYNDTTLAVHSKKRPVYVRKQNDTIQVYPFPNTDSLIDQVRIQYIRFPKKPNWAYKIINQKPFYESSNSVNFELHPSDESELVYRILFMAGVAIEKPQLSQAAAALQTSSIQQEKR